jgi:competence protein ComEC
LIGLFNFSSFYTFTKFNLEPKILEIKNKSYLKVRVIEEPEYAKKIKFLAKTIPEKAKILVSLPNKANLGKIHYGDILDISGKFTQPEPATNLGQFDYSKYLKYKGIAGIFRAKTANKIKATIANPCKKLAYYLKNKIVVINKKTLPFPYSEIYTGLVFGDHGITLPKEIQKKFKKVGLTHLLVVSGSQVALLSGILLNIFAAINLSSRTTFSLITLCNILFYFLTGGGASILRAILMSEIALSIKLLRRNSNFYHVLALSAFIMLVINPLYLFDIGAYLSFMATIALIFGVNKLANILPKKWPSKIKLALSLALAPFIFTFPILWFYFQQISPISIIANLIVINAIELLVTLGFFSTIIGFLILPITQVVNNFCFLVIKTLSVIVDFLANIPFGSFNISKPHPIIILALYLIIFFVFDAISKNNLKKLKIYLCFGTCLIALLIIPSLIPGKYLTVTFLDVGQGDAAFIQTPDGKNILIDGGDIFIDFKTGKTIFDTGENIIMPFLRHKGINKLDLVITTHFHSDHVGGVPFVLNNIPIGIALDNNRQNHRYKSYKDAIKINEIQQLPATKDLVFNFNKNISLKILYPFRSFATRVQKNQNSHRNPNNNSVVCKLSYGNIDFLFTGDLEKEKEIELAKIYNNRLEAEVLKAGHHGSATSSSPRFLKFVNPIFSVISVGKKNKFRHPSKSVLTRLKNSNCKILRTDKHGAITFKTDGKKLYFSTYRSAL